MWNLVCFPAKLWKSYSDGFHESWLRGDICAKRRKIFSIGSGSLTSDLWDRVLALEFALLQLLFVRMVTEMWQKWQIWKIRTH